MQHFYAIRPKEEEWIAYTSNRGGSYDIWLYHLSQGIDTQVTSGIGESFSIPFWSPDSRRIAFVGRNSILFVIQLVEGAVARIDQFAEGLGVFLSWSPDSQQLAYIKQDDIMLYNVITHRVQRINEPAATDVQWFPSGTALLFQAPDSDGISQLFGMQTDGAARQQITQNTEGRLNNVRLSPDGTFVLYTTPGVSISIIFTIDLTTGSVFEVMGGPLGRNYNPAWSPDSSTIAYSANTFENGVGYFSLIRTTGRQAEGDRTRAMSNCFSTPVTWSPDSRKVAYLSGCENGTASEMWVIDVGHPVPVKVTSGALMTSLQWSPGTDPFSVRTYTDAVYKVQFEYPAHWEEVADRRYEGRDGFFQISAIATDEPLHFVCRNEAFHPLFPYGSNPRIFNTLIENQEACFIFPSADQPVEMRRQAALLVRYPIPIQIEGTTYHYFILWADENHLKNLSSTLTFLHPR
ncbi:hypothetical protein D7Z54_18885 [Salibacterium salarium]|uniref:TolB protein n=1 Tax=Salibacterium salarium TaxID=284579 RepID=A0A428N0Q0_9BACI|nr:PD40 domain-containing protein [Salibacterium salarium]RSL31862.1 hypothetical protein D7Z54_18885 [Salibacterium salarium]